MTAPDHLLASLLTYLGIAASKSAAKRLILQGSVEVDPLHDAALISIGPVRRYVVRTIVRTGLETDDRR